MSGEKELADIVWTDFDFDFTSQESQKRRSASHPRKVHIQSSYVTPGLNKTVYQTCYY